MRQEITAIQAAITNICELEERHKAEREAAKAELKRVTRALANLPSHTERVEAVLWAAANTKAPKNDLAWVIFGKEHQEFYLRKLAASPYRKCGKCGKEVLAGNKFEARSFYCGPCETAVYADSERRFNEDERRREAKKVAQAKRIRELREQSGLSEAAAKELAALMVAQSKGAAASIADFIFDDE